MLKLNYDLETSAERSEWLKQQDLGEPTQQELIYYANYILFTNKDKSPKIITDNRAQTINARETSFENICAKLENGENGIYNLISHLGKSAYLTSKIEITEEDYLTIPGLAEMRTAIETTERSLQSAPRGKKFKLQQQLIQQRKSRKNLKIEYMNKMHIQPSPKTIKTMANCIFNEYIHVTPEGDVESNGKVNLFDYKHVSTLLCKYSSLKEDSWDKLNSDLWCLLQDLDYIMDAALTGHDIYQSIVIHKIDGRKNAEIQELLKQEHNITYSAEYISSLWRNKIPKLIAEQAKKEYLYWYYTFKKYGKWKKCTRCGEVKLAHSYWYSKNPTSKDGWYSMCKECRNKKK